MSSTTAPTPSTIRREKSRDQLAFLDGLRGLAALWVLLHHARWLLWEGMETYAAHASTYAWWEKTLVYLLAPLRYGHQAVIFFFVLSGFVIHLSYAKKLATARHTASFGWLSYVGRRARRLYPPLLFALVLTWVLDTAGRNAGWPIYAGSGSPDAAAPIAFRPESGLDVMLGNLAFLMHGWFPCYGTNGPLWSLHFEWWFYMIYPVLWWCAARSLALATGVVLVTFAGGWFLGGWWLPIGHIFIALLMWWMGALLAEIYAGRWKIRWARLAPFAALLLLLPILLPRLSTPFPFLAHGLVTDTLYGFGFAGLFALCFALRERGWSLRFLSRLRPLGDFSYTLYVAHLPILVFLSGWIMHSSYSPGTRAAPLPTHFGWFLAGAIVCLVIAWGAHFLVEKPFVKRRLST